MGVEKKEDATKSESLMQLVVPYILAGTGTKSELHLKKYLNHSWLVLEFRMLKRYQTGHFIQAGTSY